MLIELRDPWFGPSHPARLDRARTVSGTYYDSGVYEVEDWIEPFLPKTAKVLKPKTTPAPKPAPKNELKEADLGVAAAESEDIVIAKVDETLTGLAKARAVRRRNMALRKHGLME